MKAYYPQSSNTQNATKYSGEKDLLSMKTHGEGTNSSLTKDDDEDFNISFDEDFFFDIQRGGIDLDE